ncbi:MAG: glycosyltransferase [Mobilitalea sp.]
MNKRLLLINNIPTPYRLFMYHTMHTVGHEYGIDMEVAFLARRERHRFWKPEEMEMNFPHWYSVGFNGRPNEFFDRKVFGFDVIKKIYSGKYEYVIVAPAQSIANWAITLMPTGRNIKKILYSEVNNFSAKRHHGWRKTVRGIIYTRANAIMTPGIMARNFLVETNNTVSQLPYFCFPNVVEPSIFSCASVRTQELQKHLRHLLGLPDDSLIFLAIGTAACKNGIRLIEAASKINRDFLVVILGYCDYNETLKRYAYAVHAEDKIILPGNVEAESVAKYLLASDVNIHPSTYDCSPLSCVEAAFSGLPMLLSNQTGNTPELIDQGNNGFLFNAYSTTELIEIMNSVMNLSANKRALMGERSNHLAMQRFDATKISHDFYSWLLKNMRD